MTEKKVPVKHLERTRGNTFPDEFQIKSETTGLVIDITGWTFKLTVNSEAEPTDDSNEIFQMSGVITDAANGLVEFEPSTSQADNAGEYFYDAELTNAAGKKRTFSRGRYDMPENITKD